MAGKASSFMIGRVPKPLPGIQHIPIIGMHLKYIIDLAKQLHPIGILWNLQTDSLKVFPDAELSAVV